MATIIVEDGSIVANANSYNSEAELTAYASDRGITLTGTPADLLIKSMDYTESRSFIGSKSTEAQGTQWPRFSAYIDGYLIDSSSIPVELKAAQLATAVAIDQGYDPLAPIVRGVKKKKVGPIEVEYQDNASGSDYARTVSNAFKKLINGGGGVSVWRV